jgi:hypothetical protein
MHFYESSDYKNGLMRTRSCILFLEGRCDLMISPLFIAYNRNERNNYQGEEDIGVRPILRDPYLVSNRERLSCEHLLRVRCLRFPVLLLL